MYIDEESVLERLNKYRELKMVYPLLGCGCGTVSSLLLDNVEDVLYVTCSDCGESRRVPLMFLDSEIEAFLAIQRNHEDKHLCK